MTDGGVVGGVRRSVRIVIEQDAELNHTAWFSELPDYKVQANSIDELWVKLLVVKHEFIARGGDPTSLAVEDER